MQKKLEIGTVKKQDISENLVKTVFLSIGSNIGNRKFNIQKTKYLLEINNVKILKTSNIYESLSWPNKNFPKYYNIIIKVKTSLDPTSLFKVIKLIEKKMGRKKTIKNFPRTCDIDIIDYNNKNVCIKTKNGILEIPHPRAHLRNFVLLPLHEISKKWVHPKFKQNITYLLSKTNIKSLRTIKII